MKELKMGDKVEVFFVEQWEKRIFIKHGFNNSIICCCYPDENNYKHGRQFGTRIWEKDEWRIPEEKKYRPFTWEERDQLRGKWVKNKENDTENMIIGFFLDGGIDSKLHLSCDGWCTSESLLKHYEFLDGSPCGMEE